MQHQKENSILIMPTWRLELLNQASSSDDNIQETFTRSGYYQAWRSLLTDEQVRLIMRQHDYSIYFVLHPNLAKFKELFDDLNTLEEVTVLSHRSMGSIQELLAKSSFLVTDYSSIAFDMAYMHRPSIYYQFDEETVFGGSHTMGKGYFDYTQDGFGPVCRNISEVKKAISNHIERDGKPFPDYASRMMNLFPFHDDKCCERVFMEITKANPGYHNRSIES